MANMTFKASLLPNTSLGYSLGSDDKKWNIYGELNGNASSADKLKIARTLTIGETGKDFDGSADVSWSLSEIGAASSSHTHSYLPLSGGIMTGAIQWNGRGENSIYNGPNDQASGVGGTLNNLVISSWYGVSFTTSCSSTYMGKNAVSINTRTGNIYAAQFNGPLNGNASSATTLQTARTVQTNLGSTSSASFNGSANITPGITGTLSISHGGTSATTNNGGYTELIHNGDTTNANTALNRGIYNYGPNNSNCPKTNGYGCIYNVLATKKYANQSLGSSSSNDWWWQIGFDTGSTHPFVRKSINCNAFDSWKNFWIQGDAVTSAVWNDYAEYRESHDTDFGYVVQEIGDDTLQKTTKRLDHFAGVTSDTWGFAQGETEKAKTPIAVAGRVLVYPGEDRNKYQPGDCVCAGPDGKVYIMTREEIREWPDRIVGTVSCVPTYDEWGGGENADRPSVKVNGRIWIKVR